MKAVNFIRNIFLQNPSNWKFWVFLALLVKGLLFVFLISKGDFNNIPGFWGAVGSDTETYTTALENLFYNGQYVPDFRLPGFGIIYLPLLFVFKKTLALNCLIIIQLILASISVYALALISKNIFKTSFIFYITFYLFLISIFSNMSDHVLASESLATSFLVLAFYYLIKWRDNQILKYIFFSGVIFAEAFLCKVIFFPLIIIFIIVIVKFRVDKKTMFKSIFIFILPFVLIDGLWIIRNYYCHHKFIPLQTSQYYPGELENYRRHAFIFLQAWGGNHVYWDPKAEIRWFGIIENKKMVSKQLVNDYGEIPSTIYTSQFNRDSLVKIKDDIYKYTHFENNEILQKSIISRFQKYSESIRKEKPFLYYVKAPLMYVKIFLVQSGTSDLFNKTYKKLNRVEMGFKIFYSLYYWAILVFGFFGVFLLLKKSFLLHIEFSVVGIILYLSFIYPLYFRYCEYRYLVPTWPFLIISSSYTLYLILYKIKKLILKNDVNESE